MLSTQTDTLTYIHTISQNFSHSFLSRHSLTNNSVIKLLFIREWVFLSLPLSLSHFLSLPLYDSSETILLQWNIYIHLDIIFMLSQSGKVFTQSGSLCPHQTMFKLYWRKWMNIKKCRHLLCFKIWFRVELNSRNSNARFRFNLVQLENIRLQFPTIKLTATPDLSEERLKHTHTHINTQVLCENVYWRRYSSCVCVF